MHAQGKTLLCLARHISDLDNKCKKQVLRVAELQSDDYHMDRALYYACRDAREHLCGEVQAGNGKVFSCLFQKKMDPNMPAQVGAIQGLWYCLAFEKYVSTIFQRTYFSSLDFRGHTKWHSITLDGYICKLRKRERQFYNLERQLEKKQIINQQNFQLMSKAIFKQNAFLL